jgi:hypothetical protein
MGHLIKGQRPREYRPSSTRRASGLSPVREPSEKALKLWNKLRKHIKTNLQIERSIRTKGFATRGRFNVRSPTRTNTPKVTQWKNTAPGIYFVTQPYTKGRFKIENIYGFVPMPSKKRTNAKSP